MGPLMRVLDADKDGKLSAKEIAGATNALLTLDKNGDGQLTRAELRPPRPPRREGAEGAPDAKGGADRRRRGPGGRGGPGDGPDRPRGRRRPESEE